MMSFRTESVNSSALVCWNLSYAGHELQQLMARHWTVWVQNWTTITSSGCEWCN